MAAAPGTPPQAFASPVGGSPSGGGTLQQMAGPGFAVGGGGGLIDTRAIGKLRMFNGKEEGWPPWAFVARGYLNLLDPGYHAMITAAEQAPRYSDLILADMGQNGQEKAVVLFNLLTQSVEGRALSVLMNVESGNGFAAWKALCEAYEPDIGGRHTAMLTGIIAPAWETVKEIDFLEAMETWEVQIRRYEVQSREQVSDSTKIAVLMKHSPPSVRSAMRMAGPQIGTNFERAKKFLRDFLQSGSYYTNRGETTRDDGGPAPMGVGAIGRDKGGDEGKKGKPGKQDKGVNKGGKFDKAKGSKTQPKKFNGECSYCYKWGHKKADCRLLAKDKAKRESGGGGKGKGSSTNAVTATQVSAAASGSQSPGGGGTASANAVYYWLDDSEPRVSWADASEETFDIEDDYDDARWVMMIHTQDNKPLGKGVSDWHLLGHSWPNEEFKYLLCASGSDEHLCRPSFGGDKYTMKSDAQLLGISGQSLGQLGRKRVYFKIIGENHQYLNVITKFKVSENASKDVVSVGKMSKRGFTADLTDRFRPFLSHPDLDYKIPLCLYKNSYYIKVRDDEAMPMDAMPNAVTTPAEGQGEEYDWEYAGVVDEEEGMELVPLPDELARDEAHARANRPRWLTCEKGFESWMNPSTETSTPCGNG